ncbi:MAG: branched-chain amino acid ABC transporter ATP-binding protein/permease [bacterium]|nr:branched-chain amino acid ABC transporter ATP-binding protein/permease [bacterium]
MKNIVNPRVLTALNGGVALAIPIIVAGVIVAFFMGPAFERIYIVFLISLMIVIGLGVYSGNSGILSFGHLSFMAIGAYVSGILTISISLKKMSLPMLPGFLKEIEIGLVPSILIVIGITMVFAWFTGKLISRLEGSAASIATLGFLVIVHGIIIAAREFTRGSQSFFGVPRDTDITLCIIFAAGTIVIARIFRDCLPGLQLRASRDDIAAAESIGIDARKRRLQAWVLSAVMVAVAGVLLGHFLGTFSPKKFYFVDTFALLAMLIIGGMESVSGAIFGTILITMVSELLRHFESGIVILGFQTPEIFGTTQIGISLVILFVMYFRPSGLLGRFELDQLLRKKRPAAIHWELSGTFQHELGMQSSDGSLRASEIVMNFAGLRAIDRVSLELHPNEILGLIGPNGSGKTTLLNILSGSLESTEGSVFIDGRNVSRLKAHQIARLNLARTFQNIKLFPSLTVKEHIEVAALSAGAADNESTVELVAKLLKFLGLEKDCHRLAAELPYGRQRKVEIARALALRPKYLLLDEPAAGMNSGESRQLMEEMMQLRDNMGIGLLIVDHDMEVMMGLCDRMLVLNEGRLLAEGSPDMIKNHPAVIEAYMGRKYAQKQGITV